MENKTKQSYAPFGSVSRKKEKKDKKAIPQPGPGSYDISLPMITPIVQTIRKRNNNIIVKLGHIGTSAFLGADQRFVEQKKMSKLGPGQYQKDSSAEKKKENKVQRRYAAQKLKQLIPIQIERAPTISEIKKVEFEDEIEMPARQQIVKKRLKYNGSRGSVWSRMTENRLPDSPKSNTNLGPGAYEIPVDSGRPNYRSHHSSSFVSGSVRSFFDKIIFQTNHDDIARERQSQKYKSEMVGPGSYEVSPTKQKKINKFQFFGSTEERM